MFSRRQVKRAAWDLTRPDRGGPELPPWLRWLLALALLVACVICVIVSYVIVPIMQGLG